MKEHSVSHLSRLLAAAVVDQAFCHLLLNDAASALARGYEGQRFALSAEEQALVLSIRADSLQAFAQQLSSALHHENGSGNGHHPHSRKDT
jgi:hypothetical protein